MLTTQINRIEDDFTLLSNSSLIIPSHTSKQVVRRLIQAGADVNSVRDTLSTPLHAAAVTGNADIVQLLLEVGCAVSSLICAFTFGEK